MMKSTTAIDRKRRRREVYRRALSDIGEFSAMIIGMPLRDYQLQWARHVYNSALSHTTETIVVEMARQSGKNEGSSHIETALCAARARDGGEIVKTAPTWKPQIVNSKRRFETRAKQIEQRLPFLKYRGTQGYIIECNNSAIQFLSAAPTADVVGATASLLLIVDEAQDVEKDKFDKDFSPMRSSTGAPVVFYGTTWTTDTLLYRAIEDLDRGRANGKYYRIPWDVVANEVPKYGDFVQTEIDRLGKDHPLIRTQYLLIPLESGGRMLSDQQLRQIVGTHERRHFRENEMLIVAGLDFAGSDESAGDLETIMTTGGKRDSVTLTIASVIWKNIKPGETTQWPLVRVLDRYEWVNVRPDALHDTLVDIIDNKWQANRVHCDATGIGETSTAFLRAALPYGAGRVFGQKFDAGWATHSRLAYNFIAQVNASRFQDFRPKPGIDPIVIARAEHAITHDVALHAWYQRGHARLEARPNQRVRAYVPDGEGHDDILIADMLCVDAALKTFRPVDDTERVTTTVQSWG